MLNVLLNILTKPGYFMNHLLRPGIWSSFLTSSGVGPCDVPFRYASEPIQRYRGTVARWHTHFRGLATAIHEISGLGCSINAVNAIKPIRFLVCWLDFVRSVRERVTCYTICENSMSRSKLNILSHRMRPQSTVNSTLPMLYFILWITSG